ncbi:hypothetical protein HMPREF3027_05680 [Porphyromonas sp. HMSC077F02]|nr:hypothetical protein HMPREF3027_05680 [Porphyromonas sp. HMSC077F02]
MIVKCSNVYRLFELLRKEGDAQIVLVMRDCFTMSQEAGTWGRQSIGVVMRYNSGTNMDLNSTKPMTNECFRINKRHSK